MTILEQMVRYVSGDSPIYGRVKVVAYRLPRRRGERFLVARRFLLSSGCQIADEAIWITSLRTDDEAQVRSAVEDAMSTVELWDDDDRLAIIESIVAAALAGDYVFREARG